MVLGGVFGVKVARSGTVPQKSRDLRRACADAVIQWLTIRYSIFHVALLFRPCYMLRHYGWVVAGVMWANGGIARKKKRLNLGGFRFVSAA
jgi:hypothetical protein